MLESFPRRSDIKVYVKPVVNDVNNKKQQQQQTKKYYYQRPLTPSK